MTTESIHGPASQPTFTSPRLDTGTGAGDGTAGRAGWPGWLLSLLTLMVVLAGTLGGSFGGPDLGDHEALVAQCARDMRLSGNWLVPHYLGEPYVRKPPLPYWLIAGLSYAFPNDPQTQQPVTAIIARLPSSLAAFGTVMLLWKLASVMFGRRVGRVAAIIAASSVFFMLYAANATVEMILTFCCTWAHLHFWMAIRRPLRCRWRRVHLFFFYVAMGLGMLAKGPFPLVMVGLPIAVWWYGNRAMRLLAAGGPRAWKAALAQFSPEHLLSRTVRAFRELWLVPGVIVFALCFVPWMIAVGARHPHAWDLWNWQYLQRAQGKYEDTRPRGFFYYVPVIGGLVLPWLFLVFEGAVSPWIRQYARQRLALLYAGMWALIGAVLMSAMAFKKPYYIAPMIPALVLLMAVVADRFYTTPIRNLRLARGLWMALAVACVGGVIAGYFPLREDWPRAAVMVTAIAAGTVVMLLLAGWVFVQGRAWTGFSLTACTTIVAFMAVWYSCADRFDSLDKVAALDAVLTANGVTNQHKVFWVERRPDSRLSFYYNRYTQQMIQPAEIVEKFVDRTAHEDSLEEMVLARATKLLKLPEPVYLVIGREEYQLAKMFGLSANTKVYELGCAPDPDAPDKDWVVLSNTPSSK